LFIDPALRLPKAKIGGFLLRKKLGLRGSHGRDRVPEGERPVLLGTHEKVDTAADIHRLIIDLFTGRREA
jgi:hypothetical protein